MPKTKNFFKLNDKQALIETESAYTRLGDSTAVSYKH